MTRLVLSLAVIGALAACAEEPISPPVRANVTSQPVVVSQPSQPVVVTQPQTVAPTVAVAPSAPATIIVPPNAAPYRPGFGVVESSSLVARPNAAAGGSATRGIYRLALRMDDGTVQIIDADSRAFMVGDRIQLTTNGQILRP